MRSTDDGAAPHHWVDAAPFRAHLRLLMGNGALTAEDVATLAGVPPRFVQSLLHGRQGRPLRRVCPEQARRLLLVTASDARAVSRLVVPATVARAQTRRLLRTGWSVGDLAEHLGLASTAIEQVLEGAESCSLLVTVRVTAAARARCEARRIAA